MVVSQAASLIDGVLETFIAAAGQRCRAVRASPPSRTEAPTRPIAGEFGSALRSLSCAVGQDCVQVLKALLSISVREALPPQVRPMTLLAALCWLHFFWLNLRLQLCF